MESQEAEKRMKDTVIGDGYTANIVEKAYQELHSAGEFLNLYIF